MMEIQNYTACWPNFGRLDYVGAMSYNFGYALLVEKAMGVTVPPRVEYALTSFGGSLCDALAPLCAWGQEHMARIEACQQEHEAKRQKASA